MIITLFIDKYCLFSFLMLIIDQQYLFVLIAMLIIDKCAHEGFNYTAGTLLGMS